MKFWEVLGFGPKLLRKVLVLGKTWKTQEMDRSKFHAIAPHSNYLIVGIEMREHPVHLSFLLFLKNVGNLPTNILHKLMLISGLKWYFTQLTVTLLNCRKVWSNLSHISSRFSTIFCKWNHCDGSTSGFSHECYHHSGWICKK